MYEVLEDLCRMVGHKLKEARDKAYTTGDISMGDIEYLDVLTHTMKSIKTTMAMIGDSEGEEDPTMKKHELVKDLHEMMGDLGNDRIKQEFRQFITKIENM